MWFFDGLCISEVFNFTQQKVAFLISFACPLPMVLGLACVLGGGRWLVGCWLIVRLTKNLLVFGPPLSLLAFLSRLYGFLVVVGASFLVGFLPAFHWSGCGAVPP